MLKCSWCEERARFARRVSVSARWDGLVLEASGGVPDVWLWAACERHVEYLEMVLELGPGSGLLFDMSKATGVAV